MECVCACVCRSERDPCVCRRRVGREGADGSGNSGRDLSTRVAQFKPRFTFTQLGSCARVCRKHSPSGRLTLVQVAVRRVPWAGGAMRQAGLGHCLDEAVNGTCRWGVQGKTESCICLFACWCVFLFLFCFLRLSNWSDAGAIWRSFSQEGVRFFELHVTIQAPPVF